MRVVETPWFARQSCPRRGAGLPNSGLAATYILMCSASLNSRTESTKLSKLVNIYSVIVELSSTKIKYNN